MKALVLLLALLAGQLNTMQDAPVVRLQPHHDLILPTFGGKLLELDHGPAIVHLPLNPPKLDEGGNSWSVEVKNVGPGAVTVVDKSNFKVQIAVGQTVHIYSKGTRYSLNKTDSF